MEILKQNATESFGNIVFQSRPCTSRTILRTIIVLPPAFLFVWLGIMLFRDPEFVYIGPLVEVFGDNLSFAFFGVAVIYTSISILVMSKQYSSDVFEGGFVVKIGNKLISHSFSEVAKTSYVIVQRTVFVIIPIPFFKKKVLTLVLNDKKATQLRFEPYRFNQHRQFADTMNSLLTNQLLSNPSINESANDISYVDKTKQNINNSEIQDMDFGAFRLSNGYLITIDGKHLCALKDVIQITNRFGMFMILGPNKSGRKSRLLSVDMSTVYNIDALHHLYELAKKG